MASALTTAAGLIEFVCAKGEAVTFTGVHRQSKTDPSPVPMTGWNGLVTVRNPDGTVAFTKAIVVTNGALGQYSWSMSGGASGDSFLSAIKRDVDIWRTDANNESEMGVGTLVITPNAKYGN